MKTKIVFKDFEGLPHLRTFVSKLADEIVGKFKSPRPIETTVIVSIVRARREFLEPLFECEVLVRGPQFVRPIKAIRQFREFEGAVRSCLHAADKILHRRVKSRVSVRRHDHLATHLNEEIEPI